VLYQGEYETEHDGTARAVRLHARALAATGVPVLLKSFSHSIVSADGVVEPVHNVGLSERVVKETMNGPVSLRMSSIGQLVPSIKHLVVRSVEQLQNCILPRGATHQDPSVVIALRDAIYANTIVYSVWERDSIDPKIARQLSRVGQCWVPCEQNAAMLVRSGVPANKVHVVPHPYEPGAAICKLVRRKAKPGKRFYSIGRWEPRKGYAELIEAFARAFRPGEATLTLKVVLRNWPDYPSPDEAMGSALQLNRANGWTAALLNRDVRILTELLRDDQILKMHFEHNIYVCSSHGEAFCLPAFDAKLAGNAMVHVAHGGTADFEDPDVDVRVPHAAGPVPSSYGWEPGATWASYATQAMRDALREVKAPESFRRPPGCESFSVEAVGTRMRDLALQLVSQTHPRAAEYLRSCVRPNP
jgi:glycosyltransferase involved in cell wall biosynthesis